jgi:LmbE family N-acetylglucosaminyl deacetylase
MSTPSFRALVVSAHPDDIEFGCAGTVATWIDAGAEVTYCIVTDGSTGTQDRGVIGESLTATRREESEKAAMVVGVRDIAWLGRRDGYVEYSLDLRRDIARVFRRVRPHRYVVMDPTPTIEDRFVNHPDHRAVGLASLDVVVTAGTTPGHFPELVAQGLEPWRGLRELWIMGPGTKPVVVDISETIDLKIEALLCHKSQVGGEGDGIADFVRTFTAEAGKPHGYRFAESFQVITRGPGFHHGEQGDDADAALARTSPDPRAAPSATETPAAGEDLTPG